MSDAPVTRPGSAGEHDLQERLNTAKRAAAFYDKQMLDHVNDHMRAYIAKQEMAFIATADGHGECDCSFRAGPPGFIRVLDDKTLIYPEYRGNGVMATLGNLAESEHIGIMFLDFFESTVGLHVNGKAKLVEDHVIQPLRPLLERLSGVGSLHDPPTERKTTPERWVIVTVEEAYIHCSKHIPLLKRLDKDIDWGTDDNVRKGGDFFHAKSSPRPWSVKPERTPAPVAAAAESEPTPAAVETEPVTVVEPEPVAAEPTSAALEPETVAEPITAAAEPEPEPVAAAEPVAVAVEAEPVALAAPAAPAPVVSAPVPVAPTRRARATSSVKLPFFLRRTS